VSLKVAFIHYHLRPGGVTRVIDNAVRSLVPSGVETLTLTGEPPPEDWLHARAIVPGLGYADAAGAANADGEGLAKEIRAAARRHFGGDPDVWHIHNHSLGKNVAFPRAVRRLADDGQRLLLHIHDFAEDGRPRNYRNLLASAAPEEFAATAYPLGEHVHYAALNCRDQNCLAKAGVPEARLHLLSNPVHAADASEDEPDPMMAEIGELVLYPARGIRRKNLGEFVLWSTLAGADTKLAITLRPANPAEQPQYERWQAFAERAALPVIFSAGERASFGQWMAKATRLITTSVAEGFGLAFLEPWLAGKPLVGRDLPAITSDFKAAGVDLGALYSRLSVPVKLIDGSRLRSRVTAAMTASYAAYQRALPPTAVADAIAFRTAGDQIDFGFLDEEQQEEVIGKVAESPTLRDEVFSGIDATGATAEVVKSNAGIVRDQFSLEAYGEKLRRTYRALTEARPGAVEALDAGAILTSFLSPKQFTLLRA